MREFALVVVHNPETPTSGNVKPADSFFALPPPPPNINDEPLLLYKHNTIQALIDLGHYVKSYMRYRTITISVYDFNGRNNLCH